MSIHIGPAEVYLNAGEAGLSAILFAVSVQVLPDEITNCASAFGHISKVHRGIAGRITGQVDTGAGRVVTVVGNQVIAGGACRQCRRKTGRNSTVVNGNRIAALAQASETVQAVTVSGRGFTYRQTVGAGTGQRHLDVGNARFTGILLSVAVEIEPDVIADGAFAVGFIAEVYRQVGTGIGGDRYGGSGRIVAVDGVIVIAVGTLVDCRGEAGGNCRGGYRSLVAAFAKLVELILAV